MSWWGWMIIGAVLLGAEVFVSTEFYLAILGVTAMVVGLIVVAGPAIPASAQWLMFAALAVAFVLFFRKRMWRVVGPRVGDDPDPLIGGVVVADCAVAPGAEGSGQLRGTVWKVRNVGDTPVAEGARAVVVAIEGVLLHVRAQ